MLNLSLAETKRDFRGMRPREHSMVYVSMCIVILEYILLLVLKTNSDVGAVWQLTYLKF